MGIEEHQKVNQAILCRHFHVELLDLGWDRDGHILVDVLVKVKTDGLVVLHHLGA